METGAKAQPDCGRSQMADSGKLQVTTPSDLEVAMTRVFDAPRRLVFEALTTAELLKQWLIGPPGWSLPVCEFELKVGGKYRYLWRGPDGVEMGSSGVIRELVPPEKVVATERFDEAWYPGEAVITHRLVEEGGKTTLTMTIRYESREARDTALKTPMDKGVAMSFDRLAEVLAKLGAGD
jgi:uncharacterized protein YndB with AHSA1/START domain